MVVNSITIPELVVASMRNYRNKNSVLEHILLAASNGLIYASKEHFSPEKGINEQFMAKQGGRTLYDCIIDYINEYLPAGLVRVGYSNCGHYSVTKGDKWRNENEIREMLKRWKHTENFRKSFIELDLSEIKWSDLPTTDRFGLTWNLFARGLTLSRDCLRHMACHLISLKPIPDKCPEWRQQILVLAEHMAQHKVLSQDLKTAFAQADPILGVSINLLT